MKAEKKKWTVEEVISELRKYAKAENIAGRERFGIKDEGGLGVTTPDTKKVAKLIGKDHALALELWKSGVHETKLIAALIADKEKVTPALMEKWLKDFRSWDVVDGVCGNLFDKTPYAYDKAVEWTYRKKEFEKRAGFSMMAEMAVHDNKADDKLFISFLPHIVREATDERNFVRKAVNWALRQIGKRNIKLHKHALKTAYEIKKVDNPTARWIANDAIRELEMMADKIAAK